jgi:hypothetical protein
VERTRGRRREKERKWRDIITEGREEKGRKKGIGGAVKGGMEKDKTIMIGREKGVAESKKCGGARARKECERGGTKKNKGRSSAERM